jgi:hypothetical protein
MWNNKDSPFIKSNGTPNILQEQMTAFAQKQQLSSNAFMSENSAFKKSSPKQQFPNSNLN